ncbi:hypothetical protein ACFQ9X_03435 [Catenulispora yoronensis]
MRGRTARTTAAGRTTRGPGAHDKSPLPVLRERALAVCGAESSEAGGGRSPKVATRVGKSAPVART